MKQYLRLFSRLPFAVKWLLITEIFYGFGYALWNLNFNFHLKASGILIAEIGTINGFGLIITAMVSLFAGKLCDRFGFRLGMVWGCIIRALGLIILAVIPNHISIYLGQLLFSIGTAFILASEFPLILSLVTEEFNHIAYNLLFCAAFVGMFVGYILGGFMPALMTGVATKYTVSLILSGLTFLLIGVGRYFLPQKRTVKTLPRMFCQILSEPRVIWFSLYGILGTLAIFLVSSMINLICRDYFNLTDGTIGIVYTLPALASGVASFLVPMLLIRSPKLPLGVLGLWLSAIILVLMSVTHYPLFIILWIGFSFLNSLLAGAIDSPMLQAISEEERGSYSGIRVCANNIGMGIGTCLSGLFLSYSNYSLNMLTGTGVILIQIMVYWYGCRKYLVKKTTSINAHYY